MAKAGLYTGIILTPVLPYITDSVKNISQIINTAACSGAQYIIAWMGMTQREGQREYYYNKLDQFFPGVKEQYIKQFGLNYQCSSPNFEALSDVFNTCCDHKKLAMKMKMYSEKKPIQLNLFK